MSADRWICRVFWDSREVQIDKVRVVNDITYYVHDDGTLGDSLGVGVLSYAERSTAVEEARRRVRSLADKMLALCK